MLVYRKKVDSPENLLSSKGAFSPRCRGAGNPRCCTFQNLILESLLLEAINIQTLSLMMQKSSVSIRITESRMSIAEKLIERWVISGEPSET